MGVPRLLSDYRVDYVTEGHSRATQGWINIHCPFCAGSRDYHLGIPEKGNVAHCWRCGTHSLVHTLSVVLSIPYPEVRNLLRTYGVLSKSRARDSEPKVSIHPFKFPTPHAPLTNSGKDYLRKRGFDPERIEREWGVFQTGPISFLDKISYSHRIIIPISWNGEIVSFQGRDITGRSEVKYLACPMKREKISHKTILYGEQKEWAKGGSVIVVEGVTDVWRLGKRAVATFGIKFKMEQVLQLLDHAQRFFIVFDEDLQAQKQAEDLLIKLKTRGREAHIIEIKGDPAAMSQDDADHLVREIL